MNWKSITILVIAILHSSIGCQFYPPGEYLRFVRVPENLKIGDEVLKVEVFPRRNLSLQPIDKAEDVHYFTFRDFNRTMVSLLLARSLEDLVDTDNPRNVLKFRITCDHNDGEDFISSSLSVTVYVEDVNDHAPIFAGAPYEITVDELTPVGLTIFRGIRANDHDKPNTPNSDVQYAITAGNDRGKFALENSHEALLTLKKNLDYDTGDREFMLTVTASDRGVPPKSTNATVKIIVIDNDDLSPKFTKGVYRTRVTEFYPLTGERIHQRLNFDPPIYAFDQDVALGAPIRYDILAGNERHLFYLDHVNGSLFLEREIDLDTERSLPGNTFVLQIQASQVDNPLKTGVARVEVEVMDLNDNLPEFEVDFYNISIVENLPNGFSVLQIIATDQDQGDNGEFVYQMEDKSGAFALDPRTGWLTVNNQNVLDREKRSTLAMKVYAKEKTPSVVTNKAGASSVSIEVTLLDANDNNPTFIPNNLYDFMISTNVKIGDIVGQVHAIDPDLGKNGLVAYSIQKALNSSSPFRIDPKTGQILVDEAPLIPGRHLVFIEASDQPINPSERRFSLAVVSIEIKAYGARGAHNGLPDFLGAPYEFWVGGNVEVGTSVGQIRVTDQPEKRPMMYDLLHSYHEGVPFAVEERSGTITVVDELLKYKRSDYDFEAVVTNERDITLVTNVTIHIVDLQEETPNVLMKTGMAPIEFHVKENKAHVFIGQLTHKNSTYGNTMKFVIANQRDVTDHISIKPNGSLYTEQPLDREKRDVYRLTIIGEYGKGSVSGTGIYQVTVYVDDENDNSPKFERNSYEGKIAENSLAGTEVEMNHLVRVHDADIGLNGQFTLTIFGNGSEMFRVDRNSGKVYFNGAGSRLDREQKSVFNLRLVAKDNGGLFNETKLKINVEDENDNAPIFMQLIVLPDRGVEVLEYDEKEKAAGRFEHMRNATPGVYALSQTHIKSREKGVVKISPLISLPENISVGMSILKVTAEDKDYGDNALIKYEMVSETYIPNERSAEPFHVSQYFMVHPTSGEIALARGLPAESEFRLNISAVDRGGLKDYMSVRISVKDVNDHSPIFKKSWYYFDAQEASYSKKILGKIDAADGDFGNNANITYKIISDDDEFPFTISTFGGVLSLNGDLDREKRDRYSFKVIAQDNPLKGESLSSSVVVEVNVLDVNDNAPTFYGYDDIYEINNTETYSNHKYDSTVSLPVYYATAAENSPIGTPITRVFANDSDFTGNGNGLLLFDIPYKKNQENLFAVDSKEGIVTTIGKLDYETHKSHNVTIVASDLGSPSLSSTALLVVTVIDVPEDLRNVERPVFAHRYYEVEVEENVPVPLKLLTLNVTESYRSHRLRYSIVTDKTSDIKRIFRIDSRNGTLYIVETPDREKKALYELRIRLDQYKVGRDMTVMVYPVTNERLGDLGLNEVKVIVRVTDINDNVPKFTIVGKPIVAAIPTSANFGYQIVRLKAKDPDLGLNGEVRYQILGRADEETRRFAIDPVTGQVRAISSFAKDAGKVFGFDVKATDRRGADDGKSSIANVFVYVLDDQKQLIMVLGSKPTDVERNVDNITTTLYNITGYDVRVRKLEPHFERSQVDNSATDLYLYAVDPVLNVVVDMDQLQKVLQIKQTDIERHLDGHKILALASGVAERGHSRSQRVLLSTLEVGVVVLGCVVFVGALATAICVMCVRRKKKRMLQKSYAHSQPLGYTIAASALGKPTLFPSTFGDSRHYNDGAHEMGQTASGYTHQHDINCPRYGGRRKLVRERSKSVGGMEKSITSVHSSGQDSGIVDSALHCQCGQSSSQSSEDSSNYEDSLKSVTHRKSRGSSSFRHGDNFTTTTTTTTGRSLQQRRNRNRSISEDIIQPSGGLHRLQSLTHLSPPAALLIPGHAGLRRSTEHLVMACTLNQ